MTPSARHDIVLGAAVIGIAALLAFVVIPVGIIMPGNLETRSLAPDFWPLIVIGMAATSGAALAVGAWRRNDEAFDAPAPDPDRRQALLRVGAAFAALFACYALLEVIGMILPTIVLCAFMMLLGGERRWKVILPTSVLLPLALYGFFAGFAGVPLPAGVFEGLF